MNISNKEVLDKEIDLIQGCINRMAQNSFMVKGWTITLVAVVLALLPENFDIILLSKIGLIATICFWYLDAFFLLMERYYRWKYEWVIKNRLTSNEYYYDLNPHNENMWSTDKCGRKRKPSFVVCTMFTQTLLPIYLPLVALTLWVLYQSLPK